jgi:hypothetical protein
MIMKSGKWKVLGMLLTTSLGYLGLPYTWDNKQQGYNNIKVTLDQGLRDDKFMELFDIAMIRNIQTIESNHCALLIKWPMEMDWGRPSGLALASGSRTCG